MLPSLPADQPAPVSMAMVQTGLPVPNFTAVPGRQMTLLKWDTAKSVVAHIETPD